jgi:hypothetical protein
VLEHHQSRVLVQLVKRDDVRVAQPADGLGLAKKAQESLPLGAESAWSHRQRLESDHAPQQLVVSGKDPPERARPQGLQHPETAWDGQGQTGHRGRGGWIGPPTGERAGGPGIVRGTGQQVGIRRGARHGLGVQPALDLLGRVPEPEGAQLDAQAALRCDPGGRMSGGGLQGSGRLERTSQSAQQPAQGQLGRDGFVLVAAGDLFIKAARLLERASTFEHGSRGEVGARLAIERGRFDPAAGPRV